MQEGEGDQVRPFSPALAWAATQNSIAIAKQPQPRASRYTRASALLSCVEKPLLPSARCEGACHLSELPGQKYRSITRPRESLIREGPCEKRLHVPFRSHAIEKLTCFPRACITHRSRWDRPYWTSDFRTFPTTGRGSTSGPTMTQDARGGSLPFGTPSNHVSVFADPDITSKVTARDELQSLSGSSGTSNGLNEAPDALWS